MANGTIPTGTGWVEVASKAITTVGFPVVVSGILLWFMLTRFQTIADRMGENEALVKQLLTQEEDNHAEELKQTAAMQQIVNALQRRAFPPVQEPPP